MILSEIKEYRLLTDKIKMIRQLMNTIMRYFESNQILFGNSKKIAQAHNSNNCNETVDGNQINVSYMGDYYQSYKITPYSFCEFSNERKTTKQNDTGKILFSNKSNNFNFNDQKPKRFAFEEREDDNSLDAVLPLTIEL